MEDVLEVYKRPYDTKRPMLCMDELPKQLLSHKRDPIPVTPGQPERVDYEYKREGRVNIFMVFEPLLGKRMVKVTERRTAIDWAHLMKEVSDELYPEAEKIVLVMDNLNTHTPASFYVAFEPTEARRLAERFEFHFTPKHGSWLNMAEIEFGVLGRQCLDRRIPNMDTMIQEVQSWQDQRNSEVVKVQWQFTAADARIKLKRLYPVI